MKVRIAILVLVGLLAASVLVPLSGCSTAEENGSSDAPQQPETPAPEPTTSPEPAGTSEVILYFAQGETVGAVGRTVTGVPAVARAALEGLLDGPTTQEQEWGMHSEIPPDTQLLGVDIADGIATVDVSPEFGSGGGSLSMQLRVAQVVFTLTQFSSVDAVRFEIDGEPVEAIGGEGLIVAPSVSREDYTNVMPEVLVEAPLPGRRVSSPVTVAGSANTFEATFQVEVVDGAGNVISEQLVTGGGSGSWEPFTTSVEFHLTDAAETPGSIVVFYASAEDGSRVEVARIPVVLTQ